MFHDIHELIHTKTKENRVTPKSWFVIMKICLKMMGLYEMFPNSLLRSSNFFLLKIVLGAPICQIYGLIHMKNQESHVIPNSCLVNDKICLKMV